MIKIAVANQKGGVGKTTIAFNLSKILSQRKNTAVLAIDNDPQANLTSSFLQDPTKLESNILEAYNSNRLSPVQLSKNLYFVGSDIRLSTIAERDFQIVFNLKEALEDLIQRNTSGKPGKPSSGYFEFAVIDSLPSFGHLHLASLTAADFVLIPVKPAPYALAGLKELIETIKRVNKYFNPSLRIIGILINQVDGRNLIMEREMESIIRERYQELVFKAKIGKRVDIEESPTFQKAIKEYDSKSASAVDFKLFTKELLKRIHNIRK